MKKEAIGIGETVEKAQQAACEELGVPVEEAQFEVLELPVKKTLGIFGGSPAKVRAFVLPSPAENAAEYLKKVLSAFGLPDTEVTVREQTEEEGGGAMLVVSGENIGIAIGHRGETLDALQYLAGLVANHQGGSYYRITLDIGSYREKRRETLEALGKKLAEKAVKSGRNCSLEPMNPYERRIIHTAVQEVEGAKSWSEGKDRGRHVVIGPIDGERPQPRPRRGAKPAAKGRRPQKGRKPRPSGNSRPPRGKSPQNRPRRPAPAPVPETYDSQPRRSRVTDLPLYGKAEPKE